MYNTENKLLLESLSDAFLMNSGSFRRNNKNIELSNFLLSEENKCAIVCSQHGQTSDLIGVAYPNNSINTGHLETLDIKTDGVEYMRSAEFPAIYEDMVLVPIKYLKEQNLETAVESMIEAKRDAGQKVARTYQVQNYGHYKFHLSKLQDLDIHDDPQEQIMQAEEIPEKSNQANWGEVFSKELDNGDYNTDISL